MTQQLGQEGDETPEPHDRVFANKNFAEAREHRRLFWR
jgi:hypothetical protein